MLNTTLNKQKYKNSGPTKVKIPRKLLKPKIRKKVSIFIRTCNKSQIWVNEIQKEMNWLDGDGVYHLLKAVLQSLRDQMSVHEAVHFSAQLPLILRGTFFESWNPYVTQSGALNKDDFLKAVKNRLSPIGTEHFELEAGVLTTLNVVKKHISTGQIQDLVAVVDPSLKAFIATGRSH